MWKSVCPILIAAVLLAPPSAWGQETGPTKRQEDTRKFEQETIKAGTEAKTDVPDAKALLIFYRPKRFIGSGVTPSVYVDGGQLARLDNGRYFSLPVEPGEYGIQSSMKHAPLQIEAKAGEAIYFEMVILAGNWRGGGRFIPAPTEDALAAIKKLKPLDKKWIYDERIKFDTK